MNASADALFRFTAGGFARADQEEERERRLTLDVADSFLIEEGSVLAPDLHRERFVLGCTEAGTDAISAAGFWDEAVAAVPPVERWFPRIELVTLDTGPAFQLRIRVAPAPGGAARVASHRGDDPRTVPHRKGPDLEAMLALRGGSDADEVVLLSEDGLIVDGITSAVLWWRDGALHAVPQERPRVDSVTARVIQVLTAAQRIAVVESDATPAGLAGTETWIVNALHGIRPVLAWDATTEFSIDRPRLAAWRSRLRALARPVVTP